MTTKMPKKRYPLAPPSGHGHRYAAAAHRIQALECANANLEKKVKELSDENHALRKLALHGLIYRLDHLIGEELAKAHPNAARVRRWTEGRARFTAAYTKLKGGKR